MPKTQAFALPAYAVGGSERSFFNTLLAAVLAAALVLSLIPIQSALAVFVTVNFPNGGECFAPGSTTSITWNTDAPHVALAYRTDSEGAPPAYTANPSAWNIAHPVTGSSYSWAVPTSLSMTTGYKIWIEGHDNSHTNLALDSSNSSFGFSTSCSGGGGGGGGGTALPTAPSGLTTSVSGSNVNFTWTDNSSNETEFKVFERMSGTTAWNFLISVGTNITSSVHTNAPAGTHEYYVLACTPSGCSGTSNVMMATVSGSSGGGTSNDTTAPIIQGVNVQNIIGSGAQVKWSTNENASSRVEYGTTAGTYQYTSEARCDAGGNVIDHCVNLTGLSSNTTYYYKVKSTDLVGLYVYSAEYSFTTAAVSDTPPPPYASNIAAPSGLTTSVSGSNVNFTWTDNSSNETEFKVFERMSGTTAWNFLISVGTNITSSVHTNAPAGTHEYYVLACTPSGCSGTSNVMMATVSGSSGVPTAPSYLRLAGPTTTSTIPLAWNDNSDNETKFAIERTLTGSSGWTFLGFVTSNTASYSDNGIVASAFYDYRVQACREGYGCSAYTYLHNVSSTGTTTSQPTPKVESWGASVGSDGKSTIGIGFNTEMDQSTFTGQNVFLHKASDPATAIVPGTMQSSGFYVNLISSNPLVAGVEYISVVKALVKNKAGASLTSDYTCKFTAVATGYYAGCPAGAVTYTSSLKGTVTDSSGNAVSNVGIYVHISDSTQSFGGMTDANGSYVISLPPATYMVELYPPYNRTDLIKPEAVTVSIMDNETKYQNFQFSLVTTAAKIISGTIKFVNGQPVTDAEVGAYNETTNSWAGAFTDTLGNYMFMVGTGKYKVSFRPRDPLTATWQWPGYFQDVEFTGTTAETRVLDFIVATFDSKIIITVIDDQGLRLPFAGIMLEQENFPAQYRRSEADGQAVFLVTPGKYMLRGYMPVELGFVNPYPQSIDVTSAQTKDVTLKFTKLTASSSVVLSGKVSLENGAAVSDAFVWAWSEQGGNAYGRTNVNGEFSVIVPYAGLYRVGAGKAVDNFPYKSSEVTVNTELATSDISLILTSYSTSPLAQPVDVVKAVTETIIARAGDGAQVLVPPQAAGTSGTVNVVMTPTIEVQSTADAKVVGTVWDINITDQIGTAIESFTDDIEITFPYDAGSLLTEGVNIDTLKPNYYDETTGAWVEISDYTVDKDNESFVIRINHLTRFALVAPADTTPPTTPGEFSYQLTGANQVTLTWVDPQADFHHTRLSRTENTSEAGSILSELVTASRYVDSAVSIGKTYYYYLEAVDAAGNSSQASELLGVAVTGSTSAPSTPTASGATVDKYPSGLLFKYANNPTVYLLQNGVKYPITDFSVFKNHVSGSRSIVTIPLSVTFDTGSHVTLKSGTLIKAKSDPTVFLVIENQKRPFTSAEEFLGLGYRFHQIQAIDDNAVAAMETTGDLARPSGTIFKYAGRATIYMLENGKKRAFPSTAVLRTWINPIYVITMLDSEVYPDGPVMDLPSGVLVKGPAATIYLVFDSTLRPLVSTRIMTSLGFRSSQVIRVSASDLQLHSVGEPIR